MNPSRYCAFLFISALVSVHCVETKPLSVLSFNIDTNIGRTEEGYARDAFPELRVNARMPKIITSLENIIERHQPDVIQIQEARRFTTKFGDKVDSIMPLVDFLSHQGYQVTDMRYNPSDRAFSYIEAVQKQKFTIDETRLLYFTKTPELPTDHTNHAERLAEIKAHNYGEEWERSAYITKFHDAAGQVYYAFNVHLGLALEHRMKASELLKQWAHEIIEQDPQAKIVITGDMNTFDDWGGPEQLKAMTTDSKLDEVTKELLLPTMQPVSTSFISFPPDFAANERRLRDEVVKLPAMEPLERRARIAALFAAECQALGGHLDRVYQYGFKSATATLIPTPQFADFNINQFNEAHVKAFIMRHLNEGPAFASDHQPVLTVLSDQPYSRSSL